MEDLALVALGSLCDDKHLHLRAVGVLFPSVSFGIPFAEYAHSASIAVVDNTGIVGALQFLGVGCHALRSLLLLDCQRSQLACWDIVFAYLRPLYQCLRGSSAVYGDSRCALRLVSDSQQKIEHC